MFIVYAENVFKMCSRAKEFLKNLNRTLKLFKQELLLPTQTFLSFPVFFQIPFIQFSCFIFRYLQSFPPTVSFGCITTERPKNRINDCSTFTRFFGLIFYRNFKQLKICMLSALHLRCSISFNINSIFFHSI